MKSESIHPRVFFGRDGVKKNTAKPRSRRKLERALKGIEKHLEQNPKDAMSQQRVATIKALLAEMPAAQVAKAA